MTTALGQPCEKSSHAATGSTETATWAVTLRGEPCGCSPERLRLWCNHCLGRHINARRKVCHLCQTPVADGVTIKWAARIT